jgi:hypothetical protein
MMRPDPKVSQANVKRIGPAADAPIVEDVSDEEVVAARLAEALEAGAELAVASRQRLFAALVTCYARSQRDEPSPPFAAGSVAVEDVAVTAAAMLRASEVTSFELAALFNV